MSGAKRRWAGLVFISIAVALIIVDSTIVNVAIPSIVNDLGITSTQVQWVQESYTLVFAALLLMFGTLADRFGRRRILVTGVVVFAAASVLAALAPSGELLIGSRVLQGVGGAMVLPTTLSLINANFRGRERGIAFAVWGSTIGGMVAVGPLLGGWLTTYYSWRWAFGINVPLAVIIVVGVLALVAESKEAGAPRRIDLVGAILSVVVSASLVYGLIEGRNYGWWLLAVRYPLFPQRQHRCHDRLLRRVRHHPVLAAMVAERNRLRRTSDRLPVAGASHRLLRRQWRFRCVRAEAQPSRHRAGWNHRGDRGRCRPRPRYHL